MPRMHTACGIHAVIVKICKPQQDLRFDLPATGLRTVETMQEVNASCLAIEAGKTIMIQKDALIARADTAGIAIVALDSSGSIPT